MTHTARVSAPTRLFRPTLCCSLLLLLSSGRHALFLCLAILASPLIKQTVNAQQTVRTRASDHYVPSGAEAGAVAGVYPLSGFDNVNLYNGKLNFALPLAAVGGRGAAGYTMALTIDQQWYVEKRVYGPYGCSCGGTQCCQYDTSYSAEPTGGDLVGSMDVSPGWSAGRVYSVNTGKDLVACVAAPEWYEQAVTRMFFRAQGVRVKSCGNKFSVSLRFASFYLTPPRQFDCSQCLVR